MFKRAVARGRSSVAVSVWLAAASVLALSAGTASATTFSYGGFSWETDRADTGSRSTGTSFGRNDVLQLGVLPETTFPGNSSFYQYEGYKAGTGLPVGSAFVSADLYIPQSWATGGFKDVAIWALLGVPPSDDASYPTLGFYKDSLSAPATIAYWDFDHNAYLPSVPINYDGWNSFRISYLAGNTVAGGKFELFVNGALVATMSGGDFDGYLPTYPQYPPIDPSTAKLYEMFLNQGTSAHSSDPMDPLYAYDVFWSKIIASLDEQYYNAASLAPAAIVGGETMIGTYTDRRGLDWDGNKYAWAHAVGGVASFDDGAGKLTSTIVGAQYGQDFFALGDPSTRLGLTFGYTNQSNSLTIPAGTKASSSGQEPSIGAYVTHADENFYADLLGQYRFLSFDASSPTSEGTVKGGSVDVAAETGVHWKLDNGLTLTPMGQLLYEHVTLDDATLGYGINASFKDTDALIARGRLLLQGKTGGVNVFTSAGVSDNLLGGATTTVSGVTVTSATGGPQAEFVGGMESRLSEGVSLFGAGEYDISFDGQSQTYVGQAGFRSRF